MNKLFLAPIAATVLATALAAPANAMSAIANPPDPIAVKSFSASPDFLPPSGEAWFTGVNVGNEASAVTISFVNRADLPIRSVVFAVRSGNYRSLIVDKGTFSPGARITHTFLRSRELGFGSTVKVVKVTFADGSIWRI